MRIVMIAFSNLEYTIELTEGLAGLEDVTLMIPRRELNRFGRVIQPHVKVVPFYFPRMRYPTNVPMVYEIIRKLYAMKPDVIHLQKGTPWFNIFLFLLKKFCLVTTIHDVILLDWPSQRIPFFTYLPPIKYSRQLIVHGEKLRDSMVKEFGRPAKDINVLPRGVNSIYTRYVKADVEEEPHTIMYFGRIWEYKGLKYLIDAEPLISEKVPDLKIIIAGKGEDFQKYYDMMVHKERFVVYNEFISDSKVNELFQRASLIVLPYVDGSQSGIVPQAYAFRKPVVITDVGSLPENVDQGVTGYVVPPRDTRSLADAIIDLLLNDAKRKRMGENALAKVRGELAWDNIARRTIEVYRKALSVPGIA